MTTNLFLYMILHLKYNLNTSNRIQGKIAKEIEQRKHKFRICLF